MMTKPEIQTSGDNLTHKERLAKLDQQLRELYGPLHILTTTSDKLFYTYREKNGLWRDDLETWRLWITTVFMPINLRIYDLIVSKTDLIIEPLIPECLIDFCAYVDSFRVILKKWELNDFSENFPLVSYSTELVRYSRQSFENLKIEQAKLIKQLSDSNKDAINNI